MRGPALAVIGSDGQLERSTAAFSSLGATDAFLDEGSGELGRVLRGEAASAVLSAGGMTAAVEAVVDASGGRHALLTLSGAPAEEASGSGSANPLLDEDLDASPAIIFLKDLDGRYLRVNAQHGQVIGGGEAQLLGNTDDKLAPRLTVDGPRLAGRDEAVPEPPQLEYIVPAFESRPALSVLRFLVHDGDGNPVAICGVASPVAQAGVAQAEAERLMGIERLAHLDPTAARAELLSQWGLLGGANAEAAGVDRASVVIPEGLVARAAEGDDDTLSRLLAEERLRAQELEHALAQAEMALAAATASAAGQESEDARLYAEQARVQSEQAQAEAEHLRSELDLAQAEVEQARAAARREHEDAEAAKAVAQSARGEAGQALLRIEQLQTEAAALSSRLEQAEADARDWRVRAEHAEVEAVQARARAEQAEADARTARSRVEEEGGATRQAESRAEQAESAARVAKSRAEQAETEARQARATAEQAETDVRKARARAEQAEADARLALARAEHAEAEARQAQLRADEAESAARQAMGRTEQTEALLLETRSRLEKAEGEARQAKSRQEESDTALAGWRTRAEEAETELRLARERPLAPEARDSDASGELREAIAAERARTDELRRTLSEAQTRLSEMAGELEANRARQALEVEQLRAELSAQSARAAAQLEDLRVSEEARREEIAATQREEMEAAREQAETARAQAETAREEAETAREEAQATSKARGRSGDRASDAEPAGLRWSPAGQRELATALGDVDELRGGFVRASSVLGARGGWDLVAVWMPDPRGLLRCVASWAREPLRELEQLALRTAEPVQRSDLGAALYAREPVCVMSAAADGGRAPESRLARAFAGGARTALLLPIRDGVARIGVLEFLSRGEEPPTDDVVLALEAVGLQLGQFAALTRARQHRR